MRMPGKRLGAIHRATRHSMNKAFGLVGLTHVPVNPAVLTGIVVFGVVRWLHPFRIGGFGG